MLAVTEAMTLTANQSVANQSAATCEPPYNEGRLPLVLLYSCVLAIGFPANLLTIFLTGLQVCKKNVLGVYLCGLSICDLTYLGTLPLWALYVNRGHIWPWSATACKLTGYIFFNNMYISIFLLCCISCDRYVAIVYSLESRGMRRQCQATLIAFTIVLVVAIGHTPVFTMKEGAIEDSQRCFEPSQSSAKVTGFNYARFVIGFLIPLLLLIFTNHGIHANVQRSTGLQSRQKQSVRRLVVGVVVLFLCCFAPYHVILLIRAVVFHFPQLNTCEFEKTMYTPYTISLGLSTINSAANPILYVLSSKNLRKEVREGLAQVRSRTLLKLSDSSSQNKIQPSNNSLELNLVSKRPAAAGLLLRPAAL